MPPKPCPRHKPVTIYEQITQPNRKRSWRRVGTLCHTCRAVTIDE